MSSVNKVVLIGNVGKDPEIRQTQSGEGVATFSLATSESWNDKKTGERKTTTEWHNIVIYNPHIVNFIQQYVTKGHKLYIEGKIRTRKWADKKEITRYTTEIVLEKYQGIVESLNKKLSEE
jgi:single-strand DNA-binding protein